MTRDHDLSGPLGSFGAVSLNVNDPALTAPQAAEVSVGSLASPRRYSDGPTVGAGGFGQVRSVHDHWLGRDVALKELHAAGPDQEARLAREARLTAELDHPGIVPIYDVGRTGDGRLYYTMRLVPGGTLGHRIARTTDLDERLALVALVRDAARAVAFAHTRGIVHRDLKPDNVMVGPLGDVQVADWGLAQPLADAASAPGPAGTPRFISPEAAAGAPCTATDDVFSLGAILYAVLAGAPPWADRDSAGALAAVQASAVPPLPQRVPPELRAIVERATARQAEARYPTALAFAEDLDAWMVGRRVTAYAYSARELTGRFVRAFRGPLIILALALVATAVLVGLAWRRTAQERNAAVVARQDAEEKTSALFGRQAADAEARDATPEALQWAREAAQGGTTAVRERAVGTLMAAGVYPTVVLVSRDPLTACVDAVPIGVGDDWLCVLSGAVARQSVRGDEAWRAGVEARAVVVEPTGHWGAVLDGGGGLYRLDLRTGALEKVEGFAPIGPNLGVSADGHALWAGNGGLLRYTVPGGQGHEVLVADTFAGDRLIGVSPSPDGKLRSLTVKGRWVWLGPEPLVSAGQLEVGEQLSQASSWLQLPGGDWLIGTTTGALLRASATSLVEVTRLDAGSALQRLTLLRHDERRLVVVESTTGGPALVDLDGGGVVGRLPADARGPFVVRDGNTLIGFGEGRSVWRLQGEPHARRLRLGQGIGALAAADSGSALLAGGGGGYLARVDGRTGAVRAWPLSGTGVIKALAFEPGGGRVAVARMEVRGVELFRSDSAEPLALLPATWSQRRVGWLGSGAVWGLGYREPWALWRPDGTLLARGPEGVDWLDGQSSPDGQSAIFADTSGRVSRLEQGPDGPRVLPVVTVPDATYLAAARDGAFWLLSPRGVTAHNRDGSVRTALPLADLPGGARTVSALAVSRAGDRLAVGALDGQITLWDTATATRVALLHPHAERVAAFAFASGDALLWSGGWDGRVVAMRLDRGSTE